MANFIDEFMKNYGSEVTTQLSSNLNVDQGTVQKLIPQLAPLILSGLKKQKDTQGGDGSILDDIAGFLLKGGSTQPTTTGKGVLGSLLGNIFCRK
jgi:hypothetical protein